MSINFGQFPTPRLPLQSGDIVVGYQIVNSVPTLAQYSMLQLAGVLGPLIGTLPPSGPAGGDLSGTYPNPTVSAVHATSGSLSGVSYTGGAITGSTIATTTVAATVTGVTGNGVENSTQLATDAFVNQQIIRFSANVPLHITGGTYNQAVTGTGVQFVIFTIGGVISSVVSVISGGTGYAVGDMLLVSGGNFDARVRITNVIGGVVQSGGIEVLYGGTGYTTGATVQAVDVPPGQRTITMTGILTSNVTYILANGNFNNASRRPEFVNNTTGAFTVTVKISNGAGGSTGTGVVLPQGTNNSTAVTLLTDGSTDVWLAETPLGIGAATSNNPTFTGTVTATGATLVGFPGRLIGVQVISATGTYTPTTGTNSVIVELQAAGGGSGGIAATAAATVSASTGSGAGAYAKVRFTTGFSGVTVTIGAVGNGGAAGANTGTAGATSSFGALISCPGGNPSGGSPATGAGGGIVAGAAQTAAPTISGGTTLASVAGAGTTPSIVLSSAQALSFPGANSMLGVGGSNQNTVTGAATQGSGFGAGASSAVNSNSQAAQAGAAGRPGVCIVYEYA